MSISISIASFKRNKLLKWNLQSLKRQGVPAEILVLDESHSGDQSCEALCKQFGARYVHSGKTKSGPNHWRIPGFAFNIGAKIAKGKTLVLSCAEIYHPFDDLKLVSQLSSDEAVVIPASIRDDKGSIINALENGDTPDIHAVMALRALDATLPFFMAVSRKRYIDIGGYDEDFTGVCWDDNDITERLILSGGKYVSHATPVVHLFHPRHNYRNAEVMNRWNHNKKLYDERRGVITRNQNREWGTLR